MKTYSFHQMAVTNQSKEQLAVLIACGPWTEAALDQKPRFDLEGGGGKKESAPSGCLILKGHPSDKIKTKTTGKRCAGQLAWGFILNTLPLKTILLGQDLALKTITLPAKKEGGVIETSASIV